MKHKTENTHGYNLNLSKDAVKQFEYGLMSNCIYSKKLTDFNISPSDEYFQEAEASLNLITDPDTKANTLFVLGKIQLAYEVKINVDNNKDFLNRCFLIEALKNYQKNNDLNKEVKVLVLLCRHLICIEEAGYAKMYCNHLKSIYQAHKELYASSNKSFIMNVQELHEIAPTFFNVGMSPLFSLHDRQQLFLDAAEIYAHLSKPRQAANSLFEAAKLSLLLKDYVLAAKCATDGYRLFESLDSGSKDQANGLSIFASIAYAQRDWEPAMQLNQEVLAIYEAIQDLPAQVDTLLILADIASKQLNWPSATEWITRAGTIVSDLNDEKRSIDVKQKAEKLNQKQHSLKLINEMFSFVSG